MATQAERARDRGDADRTDRLIAIARECFVRNGVRKTRIATIAEAAGIARQTVYASVSSRDRLIELALIARLEELAETADATIERGSSTLEDEFIQCFGAMLRAATADPEFQMYTEELGVERVIRVLVIEPEAHAMVRHVLRPSYARAVAEDRLRGALSIEDATWWVANALTPIALATAPGVIDLDSVARRFILPALLRDV